MLTIYNPATEEAISTLSTDTPESLRVSYERARTAQPAWAATPLSERCASLARFLERLQADEERLAALLTSEMGKPLQQARNEIRGLYGRVRFFLEHTEAALQPHDASPPQGHEAYSPSLRELIRYEPLGVIANISAWNYPYFVGCNVLLPALLTGNAVLYKPSEITALTGLALVEHLHQAGFPKDILIPVIGGGEIGAALTALPLNGFFFTGSYATGQKIAQATAPHLAKLQLELGGKDPTYVCEDAEITSAAASLADGAFYNAGQSCCSVERIYIHHTIYDAFVEAFVNEVQSFQIGDPTQEGIYIGPLARKAQIAFLEAQIQDALSKGASLRLGGQRLDRKGYYFAPTVLTHVNHSMEVMREESFGPIIGLQSVQDDEEAISLMNDTAYGLTAGVYTPNQARAERLLPRLNAGSVYWNCCDRVSPRLPWTGRKHSGLGSTLSTLGILAFVQPKAYHLRAS